MVIYFMVFVGTGVFLAGFGTVVSAIVESVALPSGTGEFGPFDMVVE